MTYRQFYLARPTREQVDEALLDSMAKDEPEHCRVLAAEVRALREELAAASAHNHWDRAKTCTEEGMQAGTRWAADELEAALKGDA